MKLSFMQTGLLENLNFYHSYWWMKLALYRLFFFFLEHETHDNSIAINCQHKDITGDSSQCPEFFPSEIKTTYLGQAEMGIFFKVMTI